MVGVGVGVNVCVAVGEGVEVGVAVMVEVGMMVVFAPPQPVINTKIMQIKINLFMAKPSFSL
jgi:hypothetical protein